MGPLGLAFMLLTAYAVSVYGDVCTSNGDIEYDKFENFAHNLEICKLQDLEKEDLGGEITLEECKECGPCKEERFYVSSALNRSQQSKIIYRANCWDCNGFYTIKTKRRLHDKNRTF